MNPYSQARGPASVSICSPGSSATMTRVLERRRIASISACITSAHLTIETGPAHLEVRSDEDQPLITKSRSASAIGRKMAVMSADPCSGCPTATPPADTSRRGIHTSIGSR